MEAHLSFTQFGGKRLHLGICGSIAGYKSLDLLRRWRDAGFEVGATLTASAQQFLTPLAFQALGASPVYSGAFASEASPVNDDVFPHLMPGASADVFAIIAASATTLARLANGLADEILSCQALAFPGPLVLAPAMNPRMWANPATRHNCQVLRERGHFFVEPASGRVACMEEGGGRLADSRELYLAVLGAASPKDMQGMTVMVTLGSTREFWDGIRFWSNPSTGTMGAALAVAAYLRGATVHAVCGPGAGEGLPWLPSGIFRHDVVSAREMFSCAQDLWATTTLGVFTAAVADFAPEPWGNKKFKKASVKDTLSLAFTQNPDILKTLAASKRSDQKVIGFAAETDNLERSVLDKLVAKNADMIVGNRVNVAHSGFGQGANTGFVVDKAGRQEAWPSMGKPDMAWRIYDWLLQL